MRILRGSTLFIRTFCLRALIHTLIFLLMLPPASFGAGIVPDNAGGKGPGMDAAPNGVPVVNILAPSASGLSHNQYSDFNVDGRGAILNNSEKAGVTQLGGGVMGNPNLPGHGPANVILNEVTSTNRSRLEGYIEVHGQKADVILANPNGVTINGGGFLNTNRATVTTGKPDVQHGALQGIDVRQGTVRVEGAGINASNITGFDIVSRAAEINANVYAQDLTVTTGQNRYDPATRTATPLAADGSPKPTVAIDSSALGGMYAGRIKLTSTEKGVGVNLQGLTQSAGDLEITAEGKVQVRAVQSGGDMKLKAKDSPLRVDEAAVAQGGLSASAKSIALNNSMMAAGTILSLEAEDLAFGNSALALGQERALVSAKSLRLEGGSTLQGGSVSVTAESADVLGSTIKSLWDMEMLVGNLNVSQSSLEAGGVLWADLSGGLTVDASSAVMGLGGMHLAADFLENRGLIYSGGDGEFLMNSRLFNLDGADILTQKNMLISGSGGRTAHVRNDRSGIESLEGDIRLAADLFENLGGPAVVQRVRDSVAYYSICVKAAFNPYNPDGSYNRVSSKGDTTGSDTTAVMVYTAGQLDRYGIPADVASDHFQEWTAQWHDAVVTPAVPASFLASGNMIINAGTITNTLSTMAAGKDIHITGTVWKTRARSFPAIPWWTAAISGPACTATPKRSWTRITNPPLCTG